MYAIKKGGDYKGKLVYFCWVVHCKTWCVDDNTVYIQSKSFEFLFKSNFSCVADFARPSRFVRGTHHRIAWNLPRRIVIPIAPTPKRLRFPLFTPYEQICPRNSFAFDTRGAFSTAKVRSSPQKTSRENGIRFLSRFAQTALVAQNVHTGAMSRLIIVVDDEWREHLSKLVRPRREQMSLGV